MSALEWLDGVRADLDAATPGPWRAALLDGVDYDDGSSAYRGGIYPAHIGAPPIILTNGVDRQDARLIASAPERMGRMERALRAVLALHPPIDVCSNERHTNPTMTCPDCETVCDFCASAYPCNTVAAIQEALA